MTAYNRAGRWPWIARRARATLPVLDAGRGAPRALQPRDEGHRRAAQPDHARVLALEQGAPERTRVASVPRCVAGRARSGRRVANRAGPQEVVRRTWPLCRAGVPAHAPFSVRADTRAAKRNVDRRARARARAHRAVPRFAGVPAAGTDSRERAPLRASDAARRMGVARRGFYSGHPRARVTARLGLLGVAASARVRWRRRVGKRRLSDFAS